MSDNDRMVWMSTGPGRRDTYHDDRMCPRLNTANGKMDKPLSVLDDDMSPCDYCVTGVAYEDRDYDFDHLESLKEAAQEEA